jgi:hypothetical protein
MLVTILLSPLLALAVQQTTALLIDGRQAQAEVIQVQGKNYVEVDELARLSHEVWHDSRFGGELVHFPLLRFSVLVFVSVAGLDSSCWNA